LARVRIGVAEGVAGIQLQDLAAARRSARTPVGFTGADLEHEAAAGLIVLLSASAARTWMRPPAFSTRSRIALYDFSASAEASVR
jgi:hypothetical protein